MKKVIITVALIAMVIVFPNGGIASTIVYENTGWIVGSDSIAESFVANVTPLDYLLTFSDLSFAPDFGFDSLFLTLNTSTELIDSLIGPGSFTFSATLGETYFITVLGEGGGNFRTGLFGVQVEAPAVPEPATMLLLASGLVGLVGFRRKFRK